jgi:hypothetical protein
MKVKVIDRIAAAADQELEDKGRGGDWALTQDTSQSVCGPVGRSGISYGLA